MLVISMDARALPDGVRLVRAVQAYLFKVFYANFFFEKPPVSAIVSDFNLERR